MKIWCRSCGHFQHPTTEDGDIDWDAPEGRCTLYPQWLPVRIDHFCGQHYREPIALQVRNQRFYEGAAERNENYKARYQDAERRLKKANARIKALRAKPAPL